MAKLHCFLDQPTQSGQFGFSIKFCHPTGISMPKSNVLFHHTAIKHKMNVALQKFALGATHYCKFKHTALCKIPCTSTTKPPSTSKFYVDFKKIFFKDQKLETHLLIFKCLAPCQVDLWAETLRFSAVLPLENTQTSSVASFFHTHMLPHHSKAQHRGYCGKRSFLGVAKSWKVNLDHVPWFGRHFENLVDVIIYPVMVVARTDQGVKSASSPNPMWLIS